MYSANRKNLTSFFQCRCPDFFFLPSVMASTSRTTLKRSVEHGQPCLVPDIREEPVFPH